MKTKRIPETDSIKELAQFWDTHDLGEFESELEEVSDRVFEKRSSTIPLQLGSEEARAVRKIAETKGVDDAELIRVWIREKIETS